MSETEPKTFRELIDFYNTIPRWRRIVGYVSTAGFFIFLIALIFAIYSRTGFLSYLVFTFLLFVSVMHSSYALALNLTQRNVRKVDYWYVGAAAVGLLLFAASYSTQRELVLTKLFVVAHRSGEEPIRETFATSLAELSKWLCSSERARSFQPSCDGAKRVAIEIRPHLTANQIKALGDKFDKEVSNPYGRIFSVEQLRSKPEIFTPVAVVKVALNDWEEYVRNAPPETVPPRDEETEILFGIGQLVIWPFFLTFALALRITKVTVDVFEWAK